jgi:hypothetical protein
MHQKNRLLLEAYRLLLKIGFNSDEWPELYELRDRIGRNLKLSVGDKRLMLK